MRSGTHSTLIPLLLAAVLVCPLVEAAHPSDTGEYDIDVLLDEARQIFDLDAEDAVILVEEVDHLWTADGRRVEELHRIVWIATARGIRSYADLRVPWDSAHQTLTVSTLRSWRPSDDSWTDSGPTAIVETTPYPLSHAVDYTNLRETMLLHDGVELPCVLETRYRIEDREPFAGGTEGVHAMAQGDPTLISEFVLGAPPGSGMKRAADGVDLTEEGTDDTSGLHLWTYRSRGLDPLPRHQPAPSAAAHVAWSTWADYDALGGDLSARFDAAAALDEPSRQAAEEACEDARSTIECAEMLASWVADSTAFVGFPGRWFLEPRAADRTWSTAYAQALDRAALAAAAFRNAGIDCGLAYRHLPGIPTHDAVATLTPLEGPLVWVALDGAEGLYDPTSSKLAIGAPELSDGSVWRLGRNSATPAHPAFDGAHLRFDMSWDSEQNAWSGTGMVRAEGIMSPFASMQGLQAGRSRQVLEDLVARVIEGTEVEGLNFERFEPDSVSAGVTLTIQAGERDFMDRVVLTVGDPTVALDDPLHAAAPLYEATRGSAVVLEAPIEVVVEIHLDAGGLDVVAIPESLEVLNDVGGFRVETEQGEAGTVYRRSLRIDRAAISADQWPQLRALLLANANRKNRVLLFE